MLRLQLLFSSVGGSYIASGSGGGDEVPGAASSVPAEEEGEVGRFGIGVGCGSRVAAVAVRHLGGQRGDGEGGTDGGIWEDREEEGSSSSPSP